MKGFTKLRFSKGPAGCRSGKLLSERRVGHSAVTGHPVIKCPDHQEKGAMLTAANMHVAKKSMSTLFRNACCIIDMHVA